MFCVRPRLATIPFVAALLFPSHSGDAADPLEVIVRPTFATEPANARITARIERHPDNRWLVIEADAPTFFRSSHRQLDGEHDSRTHNLLLTHLPAGDYEITVRLSGDDGIRAIETLDLKVIGQTR